MRAVSTFLLLLVGVSVSELAVVSEKVPEPVEDWTEAEDWTQNDVISNRNHYSQTVNVGCPLSTCVGLASDLGSAEEKLRSMEGIIRSMGEHMKSTEEKMWAMEGRMKTTEEEINTMRDRLQASEDQAQELATVKTRVSTMEGELQASQSEIEQLKSEHAVKVAFFASLMSSHTHTGPYDALTTLVYRNVLTNIGNAYNPGTGIFTAPVKGVYFFSFYYHASTLNKGELFLQKNGQNIAVTSHHKIDLGTSNGSNGATVQLEVGDHVCVMLGPNGWVYNSRHTTFNGYLVYQLP